MHPCLLQSGLAETIDSASPNPSDQDPMTQNPTISLYPNPTKSNFTLTLPPNTSTCTLKIHDITGREVAPARTYRAGDPPVDVTHLSAGLYFVEVRVKDRVEVIKLVKQ